MKQTEQPLKEFQVNFTPPIKLSRHEDRQSIKSYNIIARTKEEAKNRAIKLLQTIRFTTHEVTTIKKISGKVIPNIGSESTGHVFHRSSPQHFSFTRH